MFLTAILKGIPRRILPLFVFLLIAPFFAGLYFDFFACLASIFLFIYFIYLTAKQKQTVFLLGLSAIGAVVPLCYLVCSLWAIDSGMTVLGFLKFLPLLPFTLIMMQLEENERQKLLLSVPIGGIIMTLTSLLLGLFPKLEPFFYIDTRLAGFFQYSNTFALYLLLGFIVVCTSKKIGAYHWVSIVVFFYAILQSGSRMVFLLLFVSIVALFFLRKEWYFRLFIGLILFVFSAVSFYDIGFKGNISPFGRFWTLIFDSHARYVRLLYYKDALMQIVRHPFGLGFMGYHYTLREFQSGVYSLLFVHNDFLQLMLDIGWVPSISLLCAALASIFKSKNARKSLLLCMMVLHCMLDFDLQYVFIFLLLICLLDYGSGRRFEFKPDKAILHASVLGLCILSMYFGIARFAGYVGKYSVSLAMFANQTDVKTEILTLSDDIEYCVGIADSIIAANEHVPLAYSVKALEAYSKGDFAQVIACKEKVLSLSPYDGEEYESYCQMLIAAIMLYEQNGDTYSAQYCREVLLSVEERAQALSEKENELAKRAGLEASVTLSDEVLNYIQSIQQPI